MEKFSIDQNSQSLVEKLPVFMPDATLGVVRSLSPNDLQEIGLNWLMVNTFHLMKQPGEEILKQAGGLKKIMNWPGFLASDSGGFQLFSLIQKNPNMGKIIDEGVVLYTGPKKQKKILFTPEDSIRLQFTIGSDIKIVLDDFSPPDADETRLETSVKRTIAWAKRAKAEFDKQVQESQAQDLSVKRASQEEQPAQKLNPCPLLLAPIQGHNHQKWRQYCADALLEIGFDIYGLGGWPLDKEGQFDYQFSQFNAQLTPDKHPRFALGVGSLENIVKLFLMGYQFFDCVLPTRDARHQRLYVFKTDPKALNLEELKKMEEKNQLDKIFDYLYIGQGKYQTDFQKINEHCDCPICKNKQVNRAYLHHLFKVKDSSAWRLATLHNLRTFQLLIEALRK
jgi:queuine tRNA-ribosyltransferase